MSSVVLISNLLYQSSGIVFLGGGQVSEELVMVSLAFHLFVVGTVIFASVLLVLCQVKNFFIPSKENVPHIKPHMTDICKRLTLKKYATTRSITHITIYNKHKAEPPQFSWHFFITLTLPVDARIDICNWLVLEWPYSSCHFQLFRQIYLFQIFSFCALKL